MCLEHETDVESMDLKNILKKIFLLLLILDLILIVFLPDIIQRSLGFGPTPAVRYGCNLNFSNYCKEGVDSNTGVANLVLSLSCLCSEARTQLFYIGIVLLILYILASRLKSETKKLSTKGEGRRSK